MLFVKNCSLMFWSNYSSQFRCNVHELFIPEDIKVFFKHEGSQEHQSDLTASFLFDLF